MNSESKKNHSQVINISITTIQIRYDGSLVASGLTCHAGIPSSIPSCVKNYFRRVKRNK